MDQFEAAKLKAQKRQERFAKYETAKAEEKAAEPAIEPVPVPSKKPGTAGFIEVTVMLPDEVFFFRLVKHGIYQNATRSKLNKNEFKNRIIEGLRPLLGGVHELPIGGD